MTKQQIEQAANNYSTGYLGDPHGISYESFIAGVLWAINIKSRKAKCNCNSTEPYNGICLNCGSSLINND